MQAVDGSPLRFLIQGFGLTPYSNYAISVNGGFVQTLAADSNGTLAYTYRATQDLVCSGPVTFSAQGQQADLEPPFVVENLLQLVNSLGGTLTCVLDKLLP